MKTGIQFYMSLVPCFRRDDVWTPAGVYPDDNRGRSDGFSDFLRDHQFFIVKFPICIELLNFYPLAGRDAFIGVMLSIHHLCHQISLLYNLWSCISSGKDKFHCGWFGIDQLKEFG